MGDSFVSRKHRIIASAIEIISESGLSALTTKNLALKENMSEALMYKYFGGIDEVLVEVVETYSKFDKGIRQTVQAKDATYVEKLIDYLEAYATYYDNYYAISTLMLQYEELLHIVETRERIASQNVWHFWETCFKKQWTPEKSQTSFRRLCWQTM